MNNDSLQNYFKTINTDLNKTEFRFESNNGIYIPLFTSSITHCISIYFLNKKNLTSSMYALVRPAVENFLRAMWVKFCVSSTEIDECISSMHFPKKLEFMMIEINKKHPDFKNIQKILEPLIKNLHDFTHGGIQSISRQYTHGNMLTNHKDEGETKSILNLIVLISSLSYSNIVHDNIGNEQIESEIVNELANDLIMSQ